MTDTDKTTARVKFTIEAEPADLMTGFRAASAFHRDHSDGAHKHPQRSVTSRWNWHDESKPAIWFNCWGDATHVRVRQMK